MSHAEASAHLPHVVIIGGGFAGVSADRALRKAPVRVTLVAGLNDHDPAGYGALIADSSPVYVEVKGYMHLGFSRMRLSAAHMPPHERVRAFAEQVRFADA